MVTKRHQLPTTTKLWPFVIFFATLNIRSVNGMMSSDVYCLKTFKESIRDPLGYLTSWNFQHITNGSICTFRGVECWCSDENKVLNLKLVGFGLTGLFPSGLENCKSLTSLNISSNNFTGVIPTRIYQMFRFVTALDLSSNKFSGEIPESLSNCKYLNVLRLNENSLTGQIPSQLGRLQRLREFSVANNQLHGQVPVFNNSFFGEDSYIFNPGLCGGPLKACSESNLIDADVIAVFVAGVVIGMVISISLIFGIRKRIGNS